MPRPVLATAIAMLLLAAPAAAAPGDLDAAFNSTGFRLDEFGQTANAVGDAVRQPDGKIVVVGGSTNGDWNVTRFNADGTLDPTFGGGDGTFSFGLAFFGGINDMPEAVAVQPDGKIVVAGEDQVLATSSICCVGAAAVARLTPEGALDTTFSGDGIAGISGTNTSGGFTGMALAPSGAIVAVRGDQVVRFTSAGALDAGFSGDGRETLPISDAEAVAVDSGNRPVVAGGDQVLRYTEAGAPDTAFDADGRQTVDFGAADDDMRAVAIAGDGDIVVAGASNGSAAVGRLTDAGAPATDFASDGTTTLDLGANQEIAYDVAVDGADRVVIAGESGFSAGGAGTKLLTARFTPAGAPDGAFSADGVVEEQFDGLRAAGRAVALTATTVLSVGNAARPAAPDDYGLVQYDASGALDPALSADGKLTADAGETFDTGREVAVQADGKAIVVGDAAFGPRPPAGSDSRFLVARFTTGGALDPSFGTGGFVTTRFDNSSPASATDVAIDSAGRIVVGGYLDYATGAVAVARYTPDGTLDDTFSGDGRATAEVPGGTGTRADGLALAGDAPVLAGATRLTGTGQDMAIVRFTAAGVLEDIDTVDFTGRDDRAQDVAVGPGGEIVAAGSAGTGTSTRDTALVRLTPAAELDGTFSGDGKQTLDLGGSADEARAVAVTAAGTLVAAQAGGAYTVARVDAAGALDPGFSGDGVASTAFGGSSSTVEDLAVQPDGAILVGGSVNGTDTGIVRYTAAGDLDATWGAGGKVTHDFTAADGLFGMGLGADTLVTTGGAGALITREFDVVTARFLLGTGGTPATPTPTPTTTATPTATYVIPTPTTTPTGPALRPVIAKVGLKLDGKGRVPVTLRCTGRGARCAGAVAVTAKGRKAGRAPFSLALPAKKVVKVKLSRAVRKQLRKRAVTIVVTAQLTTGAEATKKAKLKRRR